MSDYIVMPQVGVGPVRLGMAREAVLQAMRLPSRSFRKGKSSQHDPKWREIPYSYIFRSLQLSLWRPVLPSSPSDAEGRYFSTIGIGVRGYYDDVA
jgi:hypothetical protein